MKTFFALLAICAGNSPVPGELPTQRPVTRSFDVFFDLRLHNGWVNNGEAGDLRRHRIHYDVIVMYSDRSIIKRGVLLRQAGIELGLYIYRQTSNISRIVVGNKIVDHYSDVVRASPLGAAGTTSSFSTWRLASVDWAKTAARPDEKHLSLGIWCGLY